MYSKDLVKLLLKDGWQIVSQNGSHLKAKKKKIDLEPSSFSLEQFVLIRNEHMTNITLSL